MTTGGHTRAHERLRDVTARLRSGRYPGAKNRFFSPSDGEPQGRDSCSASEDGEEGVEGRGKKEREKEK